MRVVYLLMLMYCVAGYNDIESEEEAKRKRIIDQLTKTRTILLDNYHLVSRQIATNVFMYRSYRTVSVIFYSVMREVSEALFTFQTEELQLNLIGSCKPQEVIVNLKHGSYPAVNPDGYSFPKHFVDPASRESTHTLEFLSDGSSKKYSIKNPKPGNWYALVYTKWQDPRTQNIEQQGLVADCRTILYTDLQVKKTEAEAVELVDCYVGIEVDYIDLPAYFKCMAIDTTEPIDFNITITNYRVPHQTEVSFKVQALSLPSRDNNLIYCAFDPKINNVQTVTFNPNPSSWHYIHLDYVVANVSKIADCESYNLRSTDLEVIDNNTVVDLMRDDKGRFFAFDYGLPTTDLHDTTSLVNLTSDASKTLRFRVNQFLDIGGSLIIETSILMSLKYYMGYRRELKKGALLAFSEENQFFRVVICLDIGHTSVPLETGQCKYNDRVKPALFVLNSTDSATIYDKIIIPFPESGIWYLTFKLFCDQVVCPCRTSHNGTTYYVESDSYRDIEEDVSEITNHTKPGRSQCNATVVLSVSSNSCVSGRCSDHGNCLLNTFGGLVMSFCSCMTGYGGWDCSDGSRLDSLSLMIIAILLLTMSNLLFLLSIYVALVRLYPTEAMMYAFTMVFSTFYHACDAPIQVSYCIARGNILQFGDFYCGLMCFWVTLLAMTIVSERIRSFLQLIGAIIIALLTTWNMHSFLSFLLPVAVGIVVMLISWYVNYSKNRKMFYPKSYYRIYLPIGVVLVSVGLICYAFLQTEQNYKWVHSVWHMIIALSVVFLLPDVKRNEEANPFLPASNYCKFPFSILTRRQEREARD